MESFALGPLATAIGAAAPAKELAALCLERVDTDTRSLQPGGVFFALSGDRFDGSRFVQQAFELGAEAAVVTHDADLSGLKADWQARSLRVACARQALLDFAQSYREQLAFRVVAVTGSAGKTTTKDLLASILRAGRKRVVAAPRSFNNDVGLPLTLLQADRRTEVVVVELGTSSPGEIARLAAVAQPDVAIVTCVGRAHLEGLGGIEGVAREKLSILQYLRPGGCAVLNGDDIRLRGAGSAFASVRAQRALSLCGFTEGLTWQAKVVSKGLPWQIACSWNGGPGPLLNLPLPGYPFALDVVLAMAAAVHLGVAPKYTKVGLERFVAPPGRLNLHESHGLTLVDDTYNSNPTSLDGSLETFAALASPKQRIAVLGAMLELGEQGPRLHRAAGRRVARIGVERLVVVGDEALEIAVGAREAGLNTDQIRFVRSCDDVVGALADLLRPGQVVLFKASRGCHLEDAFVATQQIVRRLGRRAA